MRIDAHHHVWDIAVRDQPWTAALPLLRRSFAIDELAPDLARHRIEATVVVQTVPVAKETPELLAVAAAQPIIVGVVGWVDLTAGDVADRLAALLSAPGGAFLVGIRHPVQDESDPGWLQRGDVALGLAAVGHAGLVVDLLVTAGQLDAAVKVVRAFPDVRFVLDHAGKPLIQQGVLEPWQRQMRELAALPNVVVKLSGLVTEAGVDTWTVDTLRPYADTLLTTFGPARIMYGSDWPVCLLAGSYGEVIGAAEQLTSGLSAAERAAVFGETARRWYQLETRC
jgi:L-fuconolactonase